MAVRSAGGERMKICAWKQAAVAALLLLCAGCSESANRELIAKFDGGVARVLVQRVAPAKPTHANAHAVAVYGELRIAASTPIQTANLKCFYLAIDGERSSAPYVDSIASVITDRYPANDGLISVPVYWVFDRSDVERVDPAALALVVDRSGRDCLVTAGAAKGRSESS